MKTNQVFNLGQAIYSCYQCRSVHQSLQELLFVEENSPKGFCSEKCIETFYSPILNFYEQQELKIREHLHLKDETVLFGVSDEEVMKRLIESPDEVWRLTNDLGEELYSYIKFFNKAYLIVLCTAYKNEPAYVFSTTKTVDSRLVDQYRVGELVTSENKSFQDFAEVIERKKSEVLATIIEVNSIDDISMESYINYQGLLEETMHEADEVYEHKDKYGDLIVTYIKSFKDSGEAIFYIVVCLKSDSPSLKNIELEKSYTSTITAGTEDQNRNLMTIFPVMAFPTRSGAVYREFKQGKLLSGHLSN